MNDIQSWYYHKLVTVIILLTMLFMHNSSAQTNASKPNIVFLLADQLRNCSVGYSGNTQVITPNIDKLAEQGIRFSNCISNRTLCTPYRAMLMTGRYSHSTGTFDNHLLLDTNEICIAEVLRANGYACGYLGKWHLDGIKKFDFIPPGHLRQGWDDLWAAYNYGDIHSAQKYLSGNSREVKTMPGHSADGFTDLALAFIDEHRGKQPFALVVAWGPPHTPYLDAPNEWLNMYKRDQILLRPNFGFDDELLYKKRTLGYYALTTNIDWNVSRIIKRLDEYGLAENTIIVFTSDHGAMLGSQGHDFKQRPWQESINVPLVIRYPKVLQANKTSDLLFSAPDFMPTLLGLAGIPIPAIVDGIDHSGFLRGNTNEEPESAYIYNPKPFNAGNSIPPWEGIVTKRHTYVIADTGQWLLYDDLDDPYQMRNLVHHPSFAALSDSLGEMLKEWRLRFDDPFPLPDNSDPKSSNEHDLELFVQNPLSHDNSTIRFNLEKSSSVTITLINIIGQVTKKVYSGNLGPGRQRIPISTDNLAIGIYFLRLKTSSQVAVKKVIVRPEADMKK